MPGTGQATMIAPIQLREGFVMPFVEAPGGALVHFVDLDLHSEALHLETAEPVVLIHGLGCDWRHWSRQIGWLAHSRRVIVPDVRGGAGKTRWARPGWSMADMAADIHAVTVHLGLRRPALAGISMGGMIALQYALDRPRDLARLILVDTFPGVPAEFAAERDRQLAFIDTHSLRQIAEERMAVAFTATADPGTKAWVTEMIAGGDLEGYRAQARATLTFSAWDRLADLAVPVTIIHGELDATIPSSAATLMGQAIPGATVHILHGQGHFPMLEAPGRFNPLLASALGIPADLVPAR
jgi:pimeloyl-ACP methyl ester carboxylesterase